MSVKSLCIRVPKIYAQRTIVTANKLEIRNKELEIQKNSRFIFIPLGRGPSETELAMLKVQVPNFQLVTRPFPRRRNPVKNLAEVLESQLPQSLLSALPRSLDTVGDIAIIEIPPELRGYSRLIGETVLKTHEKINTVLAKTSAVRGTYRLREFAFIAGKPETMTIHKEHGCRYYVDLAKAYFSPRLSHEHNRVASLVQTGETVVDLFAGVGPFAVLIAKKNADTKVCAVDINPDAVELLKRNIRLNRVENRVYPILGDARQIAENKLLGIADRVIMNLPEKALEFVDTACKVTKQTGGTVHLYGFVRLPDSLEKMKLRFSEKVEKAGRKVNSFLLARTIRETAPYEWQVVLDAKIT